MTFSQRCSRNYLTLVSRNIPHGCLSSTLTNLTIKVNSFDDCLYLLNGCLQSLSTLIIRTRKISVSSSNIDRTVSINMIIEYVQIYL